MLATIDLPHIVQELLLVGVTLLVGLQVWVIKELYSLKSWKNNKDHDCERYKQYGERLDKIEDWLVRAEAVMQPDRELRKELPIALDILKQHGSELQTVRESLLLTQKEITVRLEAIASATKELQSNCVMHRMLTAGKADILANFIQKEIGQNLEET